jgi:hypothetical protein
MKKILLLLFAVSLVSCSNSLESKAKKQMKKTMLEMAKNPESVKIDNVETIISNDSLCVLRCVARGQNTFGGYTRMNCVYYLMKENKGNEDSMYYEYLEYDEDDNEKILLNTVKSLIDSDDYFQPIKNKYSEKEDQYNAAVYTMLSLQSFSSSKGRRVKE